MPDSITSGSERSRLLENAGRNLLEFITRIPLAEYRKNQTISSQTSNLTLEKSIMISIRFSNRPEICPSGDRCLERKTIKLIKTHYPALIARNLNSNSLLYSRTTDRPLRTGHLVRCLRRNYPALRTQFPTVKGRDRGNDVRGRLENLGIADAR